MKRIKNVDEYYENEIKRVCSALEEAKIKLFQLKNARVWSPDKQKQIKELEYAVYVGSIYLEKLKTRKKNI